MAAIKKKNLVKYNYKVGEVLKTNNTNNKIVFEWIKNI